MCVLLFRFRKFNILSGEGEQAKPLNTTREIARKLAIQNDIKKFHTKKKRKNLSIYQLLLEYSKNIFKNIGKKNYKSTTKNNIFFMFKELHFTTHQHYRNLWKTTKANKSCKANQPDQTRHISHLINTIHEALTIKHSNNSSSSLIVVTKIEKTHQYRRQTGIRLFTLKLEKSNTKINNNAGK